MIRIIKGVTRPPERGSASKAPMQLWRGDKIVGLTGHTRHRQTPSPVSPGFVAPAMSTTLAFGPIALAASVARTGTLREAPPEMLSRLADSFLSKVEFLVSDGAMFALSSYVTALADAERTLFAGEVGAGITDLLMNALGYVWRDNAACLSSALDPHADFVYAGGNVSGHGVVLAEAHGSFAASVGVGRIASEAQRKYRQQVRPHVATMSPHGKVVHGYSIAFGSRPGTSGAFLNVAETQISTPRGSPKPPPPAMVGTGAEAAPTSLTLTTHRSNFTLMGAPRVAAWIDWIRIGGERPRDTTPVGFLRIPYAGRSFLVAEDALWPFDGPPFWWEELWREPWRRSHFRRRARVEQIDRDDAAGWFVIEEKVAELFLNALSDMIRSARADIPPTLDLPSLEPVGFGLGDGDADAIASAPDYTYALYRDGLALLGKPPPRRTTGYRIWSPKEGMEIG